VNDLERQFRSLSLEEIMNNHEAQEAPFGIINKPPSFSGKKYELEGFLTRAVLAMESRPNQFVTDESKIRFLMSYMLGKPLEWVSCLIKNNSLLLRNYEGFIQELKSSFGDYSSETVVANSRLCSLRQKKMECVFEYISEFQRIAQYSNFSENAKSICLLKV